MDQSPKPVEIKDLNKTQLVLLALLLSFVTSIATGIVTVTLLQQAPASTSQTINRVVQQTIEKVVPGYDSNATQTVVVKEDDLVVDAVTKTRANLFSLTAKDATESLADAYSLGGGSFVVSGITLDPSASYTIHAGDAALPAKLVGASPLGFAILSADTSSVKTPLPKANFGKDADVHVGQSAIIVSFGLVRRSIVQAVTAEKNASHTIALDPNPTVSQIGSYATNLDGAVIGIVADGGEAGPIVVGSDAIVKFAANPASIPATVPPADKPAQS